MAARLKSLEKDLEFQLDDFNLIGRSPDATIRLLDGEFRASMRRSAGTAPFSG